MKKNFKIVLLLLTILCNSLSLSAQDDSTYSFAANFSDFNFSNFNNTGENNSGSLSFQWSAKENIAENFYLRYRYQGSVDWNYSQAILPEEKTVQIEGLKENKVIEWQLGKNETWSAIQKANTLSSSLFQNIVLEPTVEGMVITWSVNYDVVKAIGDEPIYAVVKYNTEIGKIREENGIEGNDWKYSKPFSILDNQLKLENLIGNEKYHFMLGFSAHGKSVDIDDYPNHLIWSADYKAKTERGWGIAKLLVLLGSLGFFIYGMKLMSEGLQQASGKMLRSMLASMTSNRVKGVLTGFGITGLVQSSSVTTVMTVSFVNAGLMTLRQSAGIMMGANIGTTITAWIILIIGFKVNVGSYAYMLIAFAFPLLFIKKGKAKAWATAIVGFCILFIGLGELKDAVPTLNNDSAIVQFFLDFKDVWYGPVMFVMLGAIVTVVIQSSSAAMALTLALVSKGAIPFEVACAMVLGENIGTTITAELASLIANVHAKRSARIHSMFNVVGVTWMLLIFPFFLDIIGYIVEYTSGKAFDPLSNDMASTGIALFHSLFNFANVLLLIWFVPQLVSLAERTVLSKGNADEEFKLDFIGGPLGSTAEMCVYEAKREVSKYAEVTSRMNGFVESIINSSNKKKKAKWIEKLEKYEEITDRFEVEIADYLAKAARLEMSEETSTSMRSMLSITNDLERIGDLYFQISKSLEKKESDKIYFTPEQRKGINEMLSLVKAALDLMKINLNGEYNKVELTRAQSAEKEINQLRNKLRNKYLKMMEEGDIPLESSLMYGNLFTTLEKIGDHIFNISEAVAGKI